MKTDAIESLRAELRALEAKIDALAQQRKAADGEPPKLADYWLRRHEEGDAPDASQRMAAARLRYCEAELARLREGLKTQPGDAPTADPEFWMSDMVDLEYWSQKELLYRLRQAHREIARHRALVARAQYAAAAAQVDAVIQALQGGGIRYDTSQPHEAAATTQQEE